MWGEKREETLLPDTARTAALRACFAVRLEAAAGQEAHFILKQRRGRKSKLRHSCQAPGSTLQFLQLCGPVRPPNDQTEPGGEQSKQWPSVTAAREDPLLQRPH